MLLLLLLCAICLAGTWAGGAIVCAVILPLLGAALLVKFLFDVKNIKLRQRETGELSNKGN